MGSRESREITPDRDLSVMGTNPVEPRNRHQNGGFREVDRSYPHLTNQDKASTAPTLV